MDLAILVELLPTSPDDAAKRAAPTLGVAPALAIKRLIEVAHKVTKCLVGLLWVKTTRVAFMLTTKSERAEPVPRLAREDLSVYIANARIALGV